MQVACFQRHADPTRGASIDLNDFGVLQKVHVPREHLSDLYELCAQLPCHAVFHPVCYPPAIQCVLNQLTGPEDQLYLSKGPNVHVHTLRLPTGEHQITSIVDPVHMDPAQAPHVVVHAIARKPGGPAPLPFVLEDHDGLTECNAIARTCTADHMLRRLLVPSAVSARPTVLFEAPNLGQLLSRVLVGSPAHTVQSVFLSFAANAAASGGVYRQPLKLYPALCKLLMLNGSLKHIMLDRFEGGILGYREGANGRRTFIFAASSADFHAKELPPPEACRVHLVKIRVYGSGPEAPRVRVVDHHSQCRAYGDVPLNLNFQQILNILENTFRVYNQHAVGAHVFPPYLDLIRRLLAAPPDEDASEFLEEFRRLGINVDFGLDAPAPAFAYGAQPAFAYAGL